MEARRAEKEGVFLLTPLREGRRSAAYSHTWNPYFYSRPCGRGDRCGSNRDEKRQISTHAPAGGATRLCEMHESTEARISTHAPAGGATQFSTSPS